MCYRWQRYRSTSVMWPGHTVAQYQEYFLGVKAAGAYGWQPYHIHVSIVLKSGSLKFLETSRPVQACNGIALPFSATSPNCWSVSHNHNHNRAQLLCILFLKCRYMFGLYTIGLNLLWKNPTLVISGWFTER